MVSAETRCKDRDPLLAILAIGRWQRAARNKQDENSGHAKNGFHPSAPVKTARRFEVGTEASVAAVVKTGRECPDA
jgi:hypothetical protein